MNNHSLLMLIIAIYFGAACRVFADDKDLRNRVLRPSIGVMSEEVVREKFQSYGMRVTRLERQKDNFAVHTLIKGRPAVLELESSTGALKMEGMSLQLKPTADAVTPIIKPNPTRVPWIERTIRFEKMSIEGIRLPARQLHQR
jgi:hypothetical protein